MRFRRVTAVPTVSTVDAVSDLSGFTVGVTADRRAHEQMLMLSRLGLEVVWGPAIRTLSVAGDVKLREVTESIIATPPDYVVANTRLGIRSWIGMAASWGLEIELRQALGRSRIAARGPKATGALHYRWARGVVARRQRAALVGCRAAAGGTSRRGTGGGPVARRRPSRDGVWSTSWRRAIRPKGGYGFGRAARARWRSPTAPRW